MSERKFKERRYVPGPNKFPGSWVTREWTLDEISEKFPPYFGTVVPSLVTEIRRLQDICGGIAHAAETGEEETINSLRAEIRRLQATLDPVRDWYDGEGEREVTDAVMLAEAVADLQSDRKEVLRLTAEGRRLRGILGSVHRQAKTGPRSHYSIAVETKEFSDDDG